MQDHYNRLGLQPGATPAEIKAAYRKRLKEFPAHSHPEEFKAIRAAYEALQKAPQGEDDFFRFKLPDEDLDEALLTALEEQANAPMDITLKDMIVLTF